MSDQFNEHPRAKLLPPGACLGIVGGGQLGKMMAQAASVLGYLPLIFDPDPHAPATYVSRHITASWNDFEALKAFASKCDRTGFEFENIPLPSLEFLADLVPVFPGPEALKICQHRGYEKKFLSEHGFQTAPFYRAITMDDLKTGFNDLGPAVHIKSAQGGYDGKGQIFIRNADDLGAARHDMELLLNAGEVVMEQHQDFQAECTQIVAHTISGESCSLPLTYTEHSDGILRRACAPLDVSHDLALAASTVAHGIARDLGLIGILAVEFFYMQDGSLLVNELAPRPHNAGHWSIDAGCSSQFDQWVRCLCGLPVGDSSPTHAVEMINLIGDDVMQWPKWLEQGARLHIYGKTDVRPGRKMGHVNCPQTFKSYTFPSLCPSTASWRDPT